MSPCAITALGAGPRNSGAAAVVRSNTYVIGVWLRLIPRRASCAITGGRSSSLIRTAGIRASAIPTPVPSEAPVATT